MWDRVHRVRDLSWLQARVTVVQATGCWEWNLARNKHGYGYYGDATGPKHVTRKAHRLAFELANGYLPAVVLHRCDNPPCCNAAHLRGESQLDNVRDMWAKDRNHPTRLSWVQVDEIRSAAAAGATGAYLARVYGVNDTTISRIRRGRTWRAERRRDRLRLKTQPGPDPMCLPTQESSPG